jgi:uncharacterized membrane protein
VCILPFTLLSATMGIPYLALVALVSVSILVVILSIKFSLCFYFVIDNGLGPINALRASSRATTGAKWSLFVFGILCGLINILGVLCFLVGVFATFPTIMVAAALVYRQLSAWYQQLLYRIQRQPSPSDGLDQCRCCWRCPTCRWYAV